MNIHTFIPKPVESDVRILEVEDTINTALNAALMTSGFVEHALDGIVPPRQIEATNTIAYAMGTMLDAVRAAHDRFHEFLQQEFARDRERAMAFGEPDPLMCPSWQGAGIYRFHSIPEHEFLSVSWNRDHGWFNLVVPSTGARFMALCPEIWEQWVDGLVTDLAMLERAAA